MVKLTPGLVLRNEQLSSCEQQHRMSKPLTQFQGRANLYASEKPNTLILSVCVFIVDAGTCMISEQLPIGDVR